MSFDLDAELSIGRDLVGNTGPLMTGIEFVTTMGGADQETIIALMSVFKRHSSLNAGRINDALDKAQAYDPLWRPADSYYPGICSYLSAEPYSFFVRHQGDPSHNIPHEHEITDDGYFGPRVWGGHFWQWSETHRLSVRPFFGDSRLPTSDKELPPIVSRLAVLIMASEGPFTTAQLRSHFANTQVLYPDPILNHCDRLVRANILKGNEGRQFEPATPRHRRALQDLMNIVGRLLSLDDKFYKDGAKLANKLASDSDAMRSFIKQNEVTSNRTNGKRVFYKPVVDDIVKYLKVRWKPIDSPILLMLFGPDLNTDQRAKLLKALRNDPRIQWSTNSDRTTNFILKRNKARASANR